MALSAKVSSRNQISLPSEARKRLGIEPGDRLTVQIRDDALVLRKRPLKASERLLGIAKGSYGPDSDKYLDDLRNELEENLRDREELVRRRSEEAGASRARGERSDLPAAAPIASKHAQAPGRDLQR
ncbi:MAG TPA: AbrB/MazE/SpoVT family DNA-binding domain-containing protein [Candidatus Limnocylindrales bacterium]|jgi:AbrB family looped-hinge helix DNA binding protein